MRLADPLGAIRNRAPVPFVPRAQRNLPFFGSASTAEAQLRQYGSVGTLFAIVNGSATSVSLVDWELIHPRQRQSTMGERGDLRPVTSHLALDVLNRPNPFMSRQDLFETSDQHIELVGEGYWVFVTDPRMPGVPLEIWPVRPDRMEPVPHPTDFLSGWIYKGPDGEKIPLSTDEVMQVKMPNPLDPYRGLGPVQSLLVDLDSSRYSAEWNRNFFINSAEPGGIVEVDEYLEDDEFDRMRARWSEQHQGVAAAHRVAILEKGSWKDRSFSMRDMQFAELRRVSSEVIREAFRYPKPMLGTVEDVNRANAEAAEYIYARWYLKPRLERFKGKLNNEFLPLFGSTSRNLAFEYVGETPDDRAADDAERNSRTSAFKTLVDAGVEPDDAAEVVGLPPMDMTPKQPVPAAFGGPPDDEQEVA